MAGMAGAPVPWRENHASGPGRRLDPGELWRYRELAVFLALRDVRARYKQAAFGVGWAVVQPLATVAIFTVVFGGLADVSTGPVPYVVFALAGTIVWTYCSGAVTAATESMVKDAALVTKVYFPRLLAPTAALFPGLIAFLVGLAVLLAIAPLTEPGLAPGVVLTPLLLVWAMVAALGPGLLLAALNVRYRDVGAVQTVAMQLWLLATPVGYPAVLVAGRWRDVYALNPFVGPVEAFRALALGTPTDGRMLLVSALSCAVLLVVGLWYFVRSERSFADVI
jgi:ABC-type polysaccharide/polyol phosphate export permease